MSLQAISRSRPSVAGTITSASGRRERMIATVALIGSSAVAAVLLAGRVDIVTKAAGVPTSGKDVPKFVDAANALLDPLLVMVAAISPLVLVAGGAIMMLGGRHGAKMIVTALGTLLILGSVKGIIL